MFLLNYVCYLSPILKTRYEIEKSLAGGTQSTAIPPKYDMPFNIGEIDCNDTPFCYHRSYSHRDVDLVLGAKSSDLMTINIKSVMILWF